MKRFYWIIIALFLYLPLLFAATLYDDSGVIIGISDIEVNGELYTAVFYQADDITDSPVVEDEAFAELSAQLLWEIYTTSNVLQGAFMVPFEDENSPLPDNPNVPVVSFWGFRKNSKEPKSFLASTLANTSNVYYVEWIPQDSLATVPIPNSAWLFQTGIASMFIFKLMYKKA